ncbi:MAG TPA: glycine zipper domain-containing protein [Clostridia bacterium]|nr:glycine zipper domain-containing protein [Clostridia bacterium]
MFYSQYYKSLVPVAFSAALLASATGCRELPGTSGQQGAAIGGLGGAAAGAAVAGSEHRLLGALLGGALGAGGGYLIGANKDKITGQDQSGAEAAVRQAQANPATPQDALNATTADLNSDGYVTMDEVAAMKKAGISDQQILDRMRATGQVFELTQQQRDYLRNNGLDEYVIDQIPQLNRQVRSTLPGAQTIPTPTGNTPTYPQTTPSTTTPVAPPPGS